MASRTILILAANPKDTKRLRLDEEYRRIEEAIERSKRRDEFKVVTKLAATDDDLRRALLAFKPEIVHFSGHGSGLGLEFENELGYALPISARALAGLFRLFTDHVRCVVLNACFSQFQAKAISEHIEWVIGMEAAIGDQAAIKFSQGFYDGLVHGRGFEDAFELGRNAIDLKGIPEHQTPVLLKRQSHRKPRSGRRGSVAIDQLDELYSAAAGQAQELRGRSGWTPEDVEDVRSQVWANVNNLGESSAVCPIDGFPLKITLQTWAFCDADITAYCVRHGLNHVKKETDPLRPSFDGKQWATHHVEGMIEISLRGYMVNCPVCGTVVRAIKSPGFVLLNCLRCGQHAEAPIR
jgi:CHAT domain